MNGYRCPGQDKRFWRPEDIFESDCPFCGMRTEFWKDDIRVTCERCGNDVPNPKLNLSCAKWCKFAEQCLGGPVEAPPSGNDEMCTRLSANNKENEIEGEPE